MISVAVVLSLIPVWLCWGSFLNVLAYRLVRGISIVLPRSQCQTCRHQLSWYDTIPVVSWVFLAGRCRFCRKPISALYPAIELLTAFIMSLALLVLPTIYLPAYCIFFSVLLVSIRSDLETMLISQYMTLCILPIAFICSYLGLLPLRPIQSLLGATVGYFFLWAIARLFQAITGKKGMGEGDFELLALIGAFLGPQGAWYSLMIASIVGSLIGIPLIIWGHITQNTKIPFGPLLAGSAIFICLWTAR